jgi:hypothetical protein
MFWKDTPKAFSRHVDSNLDRTIGELKLYLCRLFLKPRSGSGMTDFLKWSGAIAAFGLSTLGLSQTKSLLTSLHEAFIINNEFAERMVSRENDRSCCTKTVWESRSESHKDQHVVL